MLLRVLTVHDAKAESYLQPFYMKTQGEALRAFTDTVNDPKSMFNKHPEDYTLFYLGLFDDSNGLFEMELTPLPVIKAIEVKVSTMDTGQVDITNDPLFVQPQI